MGNFELIKERMKKLAGIKNNYSQIVKKEVQSNSNIRNSGVSFLKAMSQQDIIQEFLNSKQINNSSVKKENKTFLKAEQPSNLIVEKTNDLKLSPAFIERLKMVAKKSSEKKSNQNLDSFLIDEEIAQKINKLNLLSEQPTENPAPTPAPEPAPAGGEEPETPAPETEKPSVPEAPKPEVPKPQPPAPKPTPEKKEKEQQPQQEQKPPKEKNVSKNQLINNVVKAVSKLVNYVDWSENTEEKIYKLCNKIKRSLTNENPSTNNLASLSILLSATEKIADEELKEVIITNFKKYIVGNKDIETFVNNILNKEKAEVPPTEEEQPEEGETEEQPEEGETEEQPEETQPEEQPETEQPEETGIPVPEE